MEKQLATYIRQHILFVVSVLVVGFLALAAGEYYLYRQTQHLNTMISEGFMQVKEMQKEDIEQQDQMMIYEEELQLREENKGEENSMMREE